MNLTSYRENIGWIAHPVLDPSILVMLMGMLNFTDTNLCQGILYCVICGLLILYFIQNYIVLDFFMVITYLGV